MAVTNEYADGLYKRSWDNTNWVNFNDTNDCYRRNWNNTGWDAGSAENGIVFRRNWNNTGWVQIYPKGVIVVPDPPPITSYDANMANYQSKYTYWTNGFARQGWVTASSGGEQQFGLITISSASIPGAGSIVDPGDVRFSGRTGASGNYNNTQTISFRGTKHASASGNPFATSAWDPNSPFTFTWKSTGANTGIPEGSIGGNRDTILRWINNRDGYGRNLCTYNGETGGSWSANYLSITQFNLKLIGYKYMARTMLFDRPASAPRMYGFSALSAVPKDENYLQLVVPEHLTHIDANEAINMLESETLSEIKPDALLSLSESGVTPKIMNIENGVAIVSHVPKDEIHVQYEGKDNMWRDCICINPLQYKIPDGVNHIRLYDKSTGEVFADRML